MRTLNRPIGRIFTAACILATSVHAFADVTWDAVKKKVADGKSYSVDYKYQGPRGQFKFDYAAVVPDKIRSEIKESKSDSSKVGTIAVYDGAKGKVIFKVGGGGVITRTVEHDDVKNTAFIIPVFTLIVDQAGGGPKVVPEGDRTRFEFKTGAGKMTVWANKDAEIVKSERIDEKTREKEVREFNQIKWNNNPNTGF